MAAVYHGILGRSSYNKRKGTLTNIRAPKKFIFNLLPSRLEDIV
jgi:hypothetical protein